MANTQTHESTPEIYGQYASDYALHGIDPETATRDQTGTLDMRGDGSSGFHQGAVLFDHEDSIPDEATGKVAGVESAESHFSDVGLHIGELTVAKRAKADATEMWLKKHDPQYSSREWL